MSMVIVNIESPLSADTEEGRKANVEYARRCLLHSLQHGEAPFAMHLLYPQVLDDKKPEEREAGIRAGCEIIKVVDVEAVYFDRGISRGMKQGMSRALKSLKPIEFRSLEGKRHPTDKELHEGEVPHYHDGCTLCAKRLG